MDQATARSLWRELLTEKSTSVIPDATIDIYINRGCEALNALVGYKQKQDTSITTTSGTQEYGLPADCERILWVSYGSGSSTVFLPLVSMEEMKRDGTNWLAASAGTPSSYYTYGRTLGLNPKPNTNGTQVTLMEVASVADFTANGFDAIPTQYHPIPVLYAAFLYSSSHPDSQAAAMRAKALFDEFQRGADLMAKEYAAREHNP